MNNVSQKKIVQKTDSKLKISFAYFLTFFVGLS